MRPPKKDSGRILRLPEVLEFVGLRRTQLMHYVACGEFPAPIRITNSGRAIGWLESELLAWRATRVAARKRKKPQ